MYTWNEHIICYKPILVEIWAQTQRFTSYRTDTQKGAIILNYSINHDKVSMQSHGLQRIEISEFFINLIS